ncbi:MAG: hypothetical protein RLZ98_3124 [Pseudomonadota bacterium]|jgi:hypothetical protein
MELKEDCVAEIWLAINKRIERLEQEVAMLTRKVALQPSCARALEDASKRLERCRSIEAALDGSHEVRVAIEKADTSRMRRGSNRAKGATVLQFRSPNSRQPEVFDQPAR